MVKTSDDFKKCAVCGHHVKQGVLQCPKCGRSVFEVVKSQPVEQFDETKKRLEREFWDACGMLIVSLQMGRQHSTIPSLIDQARNSINQMRNLGLDCAEYEAILAKYSDIDIKRYPTVRKVFVNYKEENFEIEYNPTMWIACWMDNKEFLSSDDKATIRGTYEKIIEYAVVSWDIADENGKLSINLVTLSKFPSKLLFNIVVQISEDAMRSTEKKKCQYCEEMIPNDATSCPNCRRDLRSTVICKICNGTGEMSCPVCEGGGVCQLCVLHP